jgi:ERCC4-type nuclease
MRELTVIRDTREKEPWPVENSSFVANVIDTVLETGDYTLKGYEKILCIERKKSITEFANNVVQERFTAELVRMQKFKYRYLIFEFSLQSLLDYPLKCGLPPDKIKSIRVNARFLMRFVAEIQVKYGVHVLFCDGAKHAQYMAISLMRKVHENESGIKRDDSGG